MKTLEIQNLIDQYVNWLKEELTFEKIGQTAEITTPFLDKNNDRIQIYVRNFDGKLLLTDDGTTVSELRLAGLNIDHSKQRKKILQVILNGFGVERIRDDIQTFATYQNFGQKKHNLIQAMLAVNDLFVLSATNIKSLFFEDVENWMIANEVRYTKYVKFPGKSGYDHNFDFVIPSSKAKGERIVRAINSPSKSTSGNFLWSFSDVKLMRSPDIAGIAILNDRNQKISEDVLNALRHYDVLPIPWTEREKFVDELAA